METTDLMDMPQEEKKALRVLESWASWGGWVVLDTETTSLTGHVIEIAILNSQGDTLLDTLVQSEHHEIGVEARNTHGITDYEMMGAPTWKEVWPQLREALTGKEVLAYNAQFDAKRITETLQDHGIIGDLGGYMGTFFPWPHEINCIMASYIRARSNWNEEEERYDWISLGEAAEREDLKTEEELHRAKADVDLARRLVLSFEGEPTG